MLVYPLELQKGSAFHIASNHVPKHHFMFICPYYNNMVITTATIIYVLINYWMPHLVCQARQHINATLDSILKSRDITLPTKVRLVKAMAFPVVMYECESWNKKKAAAAAAKSLQSCPTLVWSHRWQPTRLPRPWDSPGKNTGVGCQFLLQCVIVKSESEVAQSCLTLSDPVNHSLSVSSIHGIFQARVLEWDAIAFSEKES